MREILKSGVIDTRDNPKVTVIITKGGISFSFNGKHLHRMSKQEVDIQLGSDWIERECDSLYFTYRGDDYFISEKQIEVLCEQQQALNKEYVVGEINTFDSEQIKAFSRNNPMVRGIRTKFASDLVRGMSNMFAFRARFTRAI